MRDISTPENAKGFEDWAYKSTYSKTYMGTHGPPAPNGRVRTSQFYPSGRPHLDSTYQADFMNFPVHKRESVPYGSSSGYRKNNPHPHNMQAAFKHPNKDYYVWSQYRRLPPLGSNTEGLNSQILLQQVCQDKTRSIYQQDFKQLQPPYATDFISSIPTSTRVASCVPQGSSVLRSQESSVGPQGSASMGLQSQQS